MKVKNQTQIQQREKELQEVNQALQTLKQKRSEVTESIRAQERAEVSRAEGLLEQLELEITKLKSRDAEKEDPVDFLQVKPPTLKLL
ncbi:hypothetical protein AALO_G00037760 [Alosa alosa]|uniref:TRIM8/14/16/25/29/45/65 coiled-coil region domain-containing protein n=1 Tax=Alosa alosa TaxID=278164 RepID=A0AAV6HA77_9TELE|nr:hypothetical protein AALO_G00037760 [Alosa alosa]